MIYLAQGGNVMSRTSLPKRLLSPLEVCYHNTPYLIEVHLHEEFHLYKRTISNRLQLQNDSYNHGLITSWQSPD